MTIPTVNHDHDCQPSQSRSQAIRRKLVTAALKLFGEPGFDCTSTRQNSEVSGVDIASIAYHFGSKENLRLEVAKSVVAAMRTNGTAQTAQDAC